MTHINATITTNKGDIHLELFQDKTPITVANFMHLANTNFYDGILFHRVIGQFMAQAGCPKGNGTGGPGYQFQDEFDSSLVHNRGVISMANCGPNTNGSQFFIAHVPCPHLDGVHSVFGKVSDDASLAVLDAIVQGDTIESIKIDSSDIAFDYKAIFAEKIKAN